MRLLCEIEVPDGADAKTKLDAIANASRHEEWWREVKSRAERTAERMQNTDLDDKCGSCRYFELQTHKRCKSYGICHKGNVSPRPRSQHKCTQYVRGKNND